MEIRRFNGFDITYDPDDYDDDDKNDSFDLLKNREYMEFLRRDGKTIKIRKIESVEDDLILIYYDIIPQGPEKNPNDYNRFAEIDI